MRTAPSIALFAVAAIAGCYLGYGRTIRSGVLIDEYKKAECIPFSLRTSGMSRPTRAWDYAVTTRAGISVRVFGEEGPGGLIQVKYMPDGKEAIAADAGDYIYPADVRFERSNDRLYIKASGQPAFFGGPQTWLFEYDLVRRRQTARAKVDPNALPQEC
jgi:hypothetical protein